jgi:radial spoke head protein 4A
MITVTDKFK